MRRPAAFTLVEASGFHGARGGDVRADMDRLRNHADVILRTEVAHGHLLAMRAEGWGSTQVGESAATWGPAFTSEKSAPLTLTRRVFFTGKGGRKDGVNAATVTLSHQSGHTLYVIGGIHWPASVQDGERWSHKARRVLAHRSTTGKLRRHVAAVRRAHPDWAIVVAGDTNLDHKRAKWRRRMSRRLGLRCVWGPGHRRGSHHSRLIDVIYYRRLHLTEARVLSRGPSSDHRPILAKFKF